MSGKRTFLTSEKGGWRSLLVQGRRYCSSRLGFIASRHAPASPLTRDRTISARRVQVQPCGTWFSETVDLEPTEPEGRRAWRAVQVGASAAERTQTSNHRRHWTQTSSSRAMVLGPDCKSYPFTVFEAATLKVRQGSRTAGALQRGPAWAATVPVRDDIYDRRFGLWLRSSHTRLHAARPWVRRRWRLISVPSRVRSHVRLGTRQLSTWRGHIRLRYLFRGRGRGRGRITWSAERPMTGDDSPLASLCPHPYE